MTKTPLARVAALALLAVLTTPLFAQLPKSPKPPKTTFDTPKSKEPAEPLPELVVTHDDTEIDHSCRVVIPEGTIIPDANGDGVIHIAADGITVEFAEGSSLVGADFDGRWDQLTGVGVRALNAKGVTLRNLRVHGYKIGVLVGGADGLTVDTADLSDNYRKHLGSTPLHEDSSDWLFPHDNDNDEWITRYGAALAVQRSDRVTIHDVRVRRGQNGIILDRVDNSRIYDNDCSFLSGWGIALWRSSHNTICRNAFDFCIRGHSEGVYNRGQDSAGLLFFEQCNDNYVTQNSATHCGDGFFGFAGREALGQAPRPADATWDYASVGCNGNKFVINDFSYAAAHGWEMTFSERNQLWGNTMIGDAICGVWAGYSSDTDIHFNMFKDDGGMPYGDEGGAINIEHGSGNFISENTFVNNTTALRLWWDDDAQTLALPGVKASDKGVSGNIFVRNRIAFKDDNSFTGPRHNGRTFRGIWLADAGTGHFRDNCVVPNQWDIDDPRFVQHDFGPSTEPPDDAITLPAMGRENRMTPGKSNPVGARKELAGRQNIVMGEWGPWDHKSPMVRLHEHKAGADVYDVFGVGTPAVGVNATPPTSVNVTEVHEPNTPAHARVTITNTAPGVHAYTLKVMKDDWSAPISGVLVNTTWNVRLWSWKANPMTDLAAWRAEADGDSVIHTTLDGIDLFYQGRGPVDMGEITPEAADNAGVTADHFGTIATTTVHLDAGKWRIRTLSDDGIRLFVDGEKKIERWNIHGPTPDETVITLDKPKDVNLKVEHFENDGWAALVVSIEPAD